MQEREERGIPTEAQDAAATEFLTNLFEGGSAVDDQGPPEALPGAPAESEAVEAPEAEVPSEGRERDERGRFVSKVEEIDDAVTEEVSEEAPVEEESTGEQTPVVDSEAKEKAIRVLQRAKAPRELMSKMDDAELIQWAESLGEAQKKQDRDFGQLQQELKEAREAREREPEPVKADAPDLKEALRPVADLLSLEDEEAGALADALSKAAASSTGAAKEQLSQHETYLSGVGEAVTSLGRRIARAELGERFPQLLDSETWGKVTERADALLSSGNYEGDFMSRIVDSLEHAARIEIDPAAVERQQKVERQRKNGSSTRATGRAKATKLTPAERQERAARAIIEDGADLGVLRARNLAR